MTAETTSLTELLGPLPIEFRQALEWFRAKTGDEIQWPSPSPIDGLPHVVNKAKAIYKPAIPSNVRDVALTVRQNLESKYRNIGPIGRDDGTWVYAYHLEGDRFESSYTNPALARNKMWRSPVAVLIQTKPKPQSKYLVLGLAVVTTYADSYFFLEGFNAEGIAHIDPVESVESVHGLESVTGDPDLDARIDPQHDDRQKILRPMFQRQGQGKFRRQLLSAYGESCAISGTSTEYVLDAAHILPFRGLHTNDVTNGLLLRTDLHNLFDLGLLAIDPESRTVIIASRLSGTEYGEFHGVPLREPIDPALRPAAEYLQSHLETSRDRLV